MPARQAKDMTEQTAKRLKEGKKLGGRPAKYNDHVLRKTLHYITHYQEEGNSIPSIAGLCRLLKVNRDTIHRWAKDERKQEFHDILSTLKDAQEMVLLDGGLSGSLNPAITKLVLGKHGYTENTANTGTSVNVTINRGSVQVEAGGQTIDVETD